VNRKTDLVSVEVPLPDRLAASAPRKVLSVEPELTDPPVLLV